MKIQIREIKNLPDTTRSKNASHGIIATMIEYLFTEEFIANRLKWGEMRGFVTI